MARGITWGTHTEATTLGTARDHINACSSTGSVHRVAIMRTGVLWPSLVRWLVILIGGSSPGVGAGRRLRGGSGEHVRARSQEIRGRRSGWSGVYRRQGGQGARNCRAFSPSINCNPLPATVGGGTGRFLEPRTITGNANKKPAPHKKIQGISAHKPPYWARIFLTLLVLLHRLLRRAVLYSPVTYISSLIYAP